MITLENEKEWEYVQNHILPAGVCYELSSIDNHTINLMGVTYNVQRFYNSFLGDSVGIVTFPNVLRKDVDVSCFYIHSGLSLTEINGLMLKYGLYHMDTDIVMVAYMLSRLIIIKHGSFIPKEFLDSYIGNFSCNNLIQNSIRDGIIPFIRINESGWIKRVF